MTTIKKYNRRSGEQGQGLIEYALILVLVSVVSVVVLSALGVEVGESFEGLVCTFRGQDNCDVGGGGNNDGICADESLLIASHPSGFGAFGCVTDTWFVLAVGSSCPGAILSLDGYGGLSYDSNLDLHGLSVNPTTSGECIGRSALGLAPTGSHTVSSLHPDGNYKVHSIP